MPVTITFRDEITYNVAGQDYTHSLAGHTEEMFLRAFAHGMRQMIGDAAAVTKEDIAKAEAAGDKGAEALKRDARNKAFGNRVAWLQSAPTSRLPSDESMWLGEAKAQLRAFGIGTKVLAEIKTMLDAKVALGTLVADDEAKLNVLITLVNDRVAKRKADLAEAPNLLASLLASAGLDEAPRAPKAASKQRKSA